MQQPRSAYVIVITALIAVAVTAVSIAPWAGEEAATHEESNHPTDLESLLGVKAAEAGKVGRPQSLHARSERDTSHRPDRAHQSGMGVPVGAHPLIRLRAGSRVSIRARPGGELVEVVDDRTEFGSPTVFGVVETAGQWVGVSTPALPNDKLGWIWLDRKRIEMGWTRRSIHVSLSERQATVRERDEEIHTFDVTIGAPGTTTPTGHFTVTDTFRGDLNPVYGCCAVALSAIQPDLPSGWPGGDRIAFHGNGTGGPLKEAISNGCLRAEDEDVDSLVNNVELGTPVFIRE